MLPYPLHQPSSDNIRTLPCKCAFRWKSIPKKNQEKLKLNTTAAITLCINALLLHIFTYCVHIYTV